MSKDEYIPSWGEHNLHQRIKKRQKITTTPNPTPTTLRAIFHQYTAELNQGLNQLAGHDPIDQAAQSIQEQLKALLPEKKDATDGKDFMYSPETKIAVANFNEAIDQIEKAIEDFCSGKGKE